MSLAAKRRVLVLVLLLCALWPAAHHLLALRYGFDPWRFFGWSMYAVPDPRIEVKVAELSGGQARLIDPPPPAAAGYAFRRAVFGELLPPDDLAAELLRERPHAEGLVIRVRTFTLDRATARIRAEDRIHRYDRDGPMTQ